MCVCSGVFPRGKVVDLCGDDTMYVCDVLPVLDLRASSWNSLSLCWKGVLSARAVLFWVGLLCLFRPDWVMAMCNSSTCCAKSSSGR